MQTFIQTDRQVFASHTLGVRVMLLSDRADSLTARRLTGYGSHVDIAGALEAAVAAILNDRFGYDLFVMDCDGFGGVAGAEQAIAALIAGDAKMRVMLISREFDVPVYPLGRRTAVCLPEDVSDESFRIGFDHVLRDRAAVTIN
ncbi:hypothetical protein [Rhodobacter calidifons]|uniref:Uncharacterized protein n=1 Tax=Rhodobacter calidifons TaxID=2715277 RepID=A0ABX0G5M9_9RHOB|nr:hypothetical protein [Rhodobacter calidifons]NHB76154.1 hypothetical protein [Rhodobacter calidifons]